MQPAGRRGCATSLPRPGLWHCLFRHRTKREENLFPICPLDGLLQSRLQQNPWVSRLNSSSDCPGRNRWYQNSIRFQFTNHSFSQADSHFPGSSSTSSGIYKACLPFPWIMVSGVEKLQPQLQFDYGTIGNRYSARGSHEHYNEQDLLIERTNSGHPLTTAADFL